MSFDVSAGAYLRFMGQYSEPLAPRFADLAGIGNGQRVLDVGCGPGALTAELVSRVGVASVSAAEPSASFAAAAGERLPGVEVCQAAAEQLPFADGTFDAALAQLVVHFMADPVQGLREMRRVTRPGGMVAACVWDHAGGRGPLAAFWSAVRQLDPAADDESGLAGVREGHLASLFTQAGLNRCAVTTLTVRVRHASFDDWWEPFTLGVGPAGAYVASLTPDHRTALREQCRRLLPAGRWRSPPPPGQPRAAPSKNELGEEATVTVSRFVVQLHDATTLHFDLRIRIGDVLRSWAVPKGPSLDPSVRRLAVPVEDHSLAAGDYEGIRAGQTRGTGAVIIWDEGNAEIIRDEPGHLSVLLHGSKLAGGFALTRTGERRWILVKTRDAYARPGSDIVAEQPASVRSGRTWEDLANE